MKALNDALNRKQDATEEREQLLCRKQRLEVAGQQFSFRRDL